MSPYFLAIGFGYILVQLGLHQRLTLILGHPTLALAGGITGVVGFVLGFGFPLGVRLVAPAGERAVQKMWAVNGAASIAGSSLAALLGLTLGCRAVLIGGFVFYALAALCGTKAQSVVEPSRARAGLTKPLERRSVSVS
jgi:hypothetical protein